MKSVEKMKTYETGYAGGCPAKESNKDEVKTPPEKQKLTNPLPDLMCRKFEFWWSRNREHMPSVSRNEAEAIWCDAWMAKPGLEVIPWRTIKMP